MAADFRRAFRVGARPVRGETAAALHRPCPSAQPRPGSCRAYRPAQGFLDECIRRLGKSGEAAGPTGTKHEPRRPRVSQTEQGQAPPRPGPKQERGAQADRD